MEGTLSASDFNDICLIFSGLMNMISTAVYLLYLRVLISYILTDNCSIL